MSEKGDPARKHLLMKLNSWDKILSVFLWQVFQKTITLRINILDFWCRLYLAIIFKKANRISDKGGSCLVSYRLETKLMLIVIEWAFLSLFYSFTFIFITCQALLWSKTILEFLQIINVWRRICCQSQQGKDIVSLASGAATAQKKIACIKVASRD